MTAAPPFTVARADHVGFAVSCLDEALRFWVEGLGARPVRRGAPAVPVHSIPGRPISR